MKQKINDKYSLMNIKKIKESPSPRILLNACTHGSERVGLHVIKYFKKIKILRGTLVINIANEQAVKSKKRFIGSDLNRVFPGKSNGNYEERLAYQMKPFIEPFDVVIDIHSTESGVSSSLIITKLSRQTKEVIKAVEPEKVLYMNTKPRTPHALISSAKVGVAFEYGKDKDKKTYTETVQGINRLLQHYQMIKSGVIKKNRRKTEFYEIYEKEEKSSGFEISPSIKNFHLVKKGELIGANKKGEKIYAKESFYPVLFGKNTYKTIFGFKARKITGK
jgi:succinylglutamate desuccinylase